MAEAGWARVVEDAGFEGAGVREGAVHFGVLVLLRSTKGWTRLLLLLFVVLWNEVEEGGCGLTIERKWDMKSLGG